jgi:hypothetical protein
VSAENAGRILRLIVEGDFSRGRWVKRWISDRDIRGILGGVSSCGGAKYLASLCFST